MRRLPAAGDATLHGSGGTLFSLTLMVGFWRQRWRARLATVEGEGDGHGLQWRQRQQEEDNINGGDRRTTPTARGRGS
jgi:hypothetical protein